MRRHWVFTIFIFLILTNFEQDRTTTDPFPVLDFHHFGDMRSERQTNRQTDKRTQMQYPRLPFGGDGNECLPENITQAHREYNYLSQGHSMSYGGLFFLFLNTS